MNQQVKFGIDTIASLPTPIDTTIPANATNCDKNTAANPGSMTTVLDSTQNDGSGNSVNLTSSGVQGLVVYQDLKQGIVEVKIHRKPRRDLEPAKDFQLRLFGFLPSNSIKKFWNFYVRRVGTSLVIQSGECIKSQTNEQSSTSDISTNTASDTTELTES